MKFLKKPKYKIIILVVFIIIMILAFLGIKELIYPNSSIDLYGNRLDGIEEFPIKADTVSNIKDLITETDKTNSVDYYLTGRIIKFIIDVKKDTDLVDAKSMTDSIVEKLSDKQQSFYDIEVFITSKESKDSEVYPIIGSKHRDSLTFVWTK
ncbi:MAG: hypothetical protein ACM3O4_05110 [Ignavibacteriales bacterium]